jgi:hypothetical protein
MRTTQIQTRGRRAPRSLPSLAVMVLVLLVAACEQGTPGSPLEPPAPALSTGGWLSLYFTSTPPEPAYVGGVYEVTAEIGPGAFHYPFPELSTRTPAVCSLGYPIQSGGDPAGAAGRTSAEVRFEASGTCVIRAESWSMDVGFDVMVEQEIEVVEPWKPGTPASPVDPDDPPGQGGPWGKRGPPR